MRAKQKFNTFPFDPGKIPFFYGWVILVAATIGILVSAPGQTTGVSTFTDYLIDSIKISRDQISTAYMFGTIASSFFLIWAGKVYDKYGARWVGMGTSLILAFVLVLLSQSDRLVRLVVPESSPSHLTVAVVALVLLFLCCGFRGRVC